MFNKIINKGIVMMVLLLCGVQGSLVTTGLNESKSLNGIIYINDQQWCIWIGDIKINKISRLQRMIPTGTMIKVMHDKICITFKGKQKSFYVGQVINSV